MDPKKPHLCKSPRLAIVIPCFNEMDVLPESLLQLENLCNQLKQNQIISEDSFLYCVDDGSQDETWEIIQTHHAKNKTIKGLRLSGNVGHQNALLAGLLSVKNKVDCAISIDADLQDDIGVIPTMLQRFKEGDDIVYGVRHSRKTDSIFKKMSALLFYKLMKKAGSNALVNHADFRLMSQRALKQLTKFKERNLFLRGIIPLIGFSSSQVYYDRVARLKGQSKYTMRKMIGLAWNGLTSFSHLPLDIIFILGIASFVMSILIAIWIIIEKILGNTIPGWTSIMVPLCFMGGVQLLSIGILGEYIAKIYLEVKFRPRFCKDTELF